MSSNHLRLESNDVSAPPMEDEDENDDNNEKTPSGKRSNAGAISDNEESPCEKPIMGQETMQIVAQQSTHLELTSPTSMEPARSATDSAAVTEMGSMSGRQEEEKEISPQSTKKYEYKKVGFEKSSISHGKSLFANDVSPDPSRGSMSALKHQTTAGNLQAIHGPNGSSANRGAHQNERTHTNSLASTMVKEHELIVKRLQTLKTQAHLPGISDAIEKELNERGLTTVFLLPLPVHKISPRVMIAFISSIFLTMVITYPIAATTNDIDWFDDGFYLSNAIEGKDSGAIGSFFLGTGAIVLALFIVLRYAHVLSIALFAFENAKCQRNKRRIIRKNKLAGQIGVVSVISMIGVASFRLGTHDNLHNLSALIFFVGLNLYLDMSTFIDRWMDIEPRHRITWRSFLASLISFLSVTMFIGVTIRFFSKKGTSFYRGMTFFTSLLELLVVLLCCLTFYSYRRAFKHEKVMVKKAKSYQYGCETALENGHEHDFDLDDGNASGPDENGGSRPRGDTGMVGFTDQILFHADDNEWIERVLFFKELSKHVKIWK